MTNCPRGFVVEQLPHVQRALSAAAIAKRFANEREQAVATLESARQAGQRDLHADYWGENGPPRREGGPTPLVHPSS